MELEQQVKELQAKMAEQAKLNEQLASQVKAETEKARALELEKAKLSVKVEFPDVPLELIAGSDAAAMKASAEALMKWKGVSNGVKAEPAKTNPQTDEEKAKAAKGAEIAAQFAKAGNINPSTDAVAMQKAEEAKAAAEKLKASGNPYQVATHLVGASAEKIARMIGGTVKK